MDPVKKTDEGKPGLYVRLYKWVLVTKSHYVTIMSDGKPTDIQVSMTDWELGSDVILTTKTSAESTPEIPEFLGSFKLTHLEPGYFLISISASSTAPLLTTEPRGGFNWTVPLEGNDDTEIRGLQVLNGQTTYWTNFEQAYK